MQIPRLYFGCMDVKVPHIELTKIGVKVTKPYATGYGWIAIEMKDPDEYGLCFHSPQ